MPVGDPRRQEIRRRRKRLLLIFAALSALVVPVVAVLVWKDGSESSAVPPGRIAYNTRAGDLFVVDSDGSNRRQLTRSGDGIDYNPTWSPDGRHIAFRTTRGESYRGDVDPSNIFVINSNGSGERQLTPPRRDLGGSGGLFPAWSPRGDRIAFSNGHGINLMRPDGTVVKTLGVQGECSVWSPDGSRIMFCSNAIDRGKRVDNWDVFVMGADGSNVRRLTRDPAQDYPGAGSPDGKHIVFASNRSGNFDLYLVDADGTNLRRITNDPGGEAANAWLPNGKLVVSLSIPDVEGPPEWVLTNPDGSGRVALPQLDEALDPIAWLPISEPN
jgi:Tol biopolymer transport system component